MKFDYARNALKYLIEAYNIKELYLPYYLCDVIRHSVFEAKCKPLFYHIDDNFMPDILFPPTSFILYPNYFGICDSNIRKLISIYPNIIIDNAHAFYADPRGFASFNSMRKFLPVKNGSYLWIGTGENKFPKDTGRREIFNKYHKNFAPGNLLNIDLPSDSIPFCYPYLASTIKEADDLVKYLKSEGNIIYRYWNCLPESYNEYKFYSRLVPIPLNASNIQQDNLLHQKGVQEI